MLANEVGHSNMQANVIKEDFKMIVVRRKLSSIPNDPEEYDFDDDFNSNSATAESYIDSTGDTGIGLFLVNGETNTPPTWNDFLIYAQTVPVISEQVTSSVSGEYAIAKGNTSQNAGQTNWYFDCRADASLWLPQYTNSGIEPIDDGYVYAYDCWLTPFKFYRFGLWVDSGAICFKWYGNSNLVSPSYTDGGLLSEPELSSRTNLTQLISFEVNYYSGIVSSYTTFLQPRLPNIYFLPCKMDNKIALNINWFYSNNDTNDALCYPMACSNSYRDDTMIDGGKEENDINYDGILRKYYSQEGDLVSGDIPEKVFEEEKIFIREIKVVASTVFTGVGTPILTFNNKNLSYLHSNCISDCWVKDFDGERIEDVQIDNNGMPTNYNDEYKGTLPKGQFNMPNSDFPRNYVGSTYGTVYNPENREGKNVGTYLKTRATKSGYSTNRTLMQIIRPSTATEKIALDSDFNERYYANEEAKAQMVDLCYKDDGYAHVFIIYFDTNNRGNQVAFITYYNPFFRTESDSYSYNLNQWSPYIIVLGGVYGSYDAYDPFSYTGYFGKFSSSDNGYRDTSCQDYCNGATIQCLPILKDYNTNINIPFCNGLASDKLPIRVWYCEFPFTNGITGEDSYQSSIAFTSCAEEWQVATYLSTTTYLGTFCLTGNNDTQPIDNPMNKNDNGKISTPNDDENQGEGSKSKNPDDKGTHDNRVIDTPKVPPKTTNILASGLLSMYVIDNDNLRKLGSDLFSDNVFQQIKVGVSKPLDCVLRIAESRITPPKESSDRTIKLGGANISARGTRVTKDIKKVDCGSTYIARRNGDYTDCNEKLQIYLPFIGYRDLDGNFLQNKRVYLVYYFNFLNGKCVANIYVSNPNGKANEKGKALYQTYNGDFITTFPLGTMSNTGMLSMLMSAGLGAISHNMYYARASIRSLPNALVPQAEHTGEFGANNATLINELTPCIHRWKINHTWSEKSGDITGEVSYKRIKLSNAKNGYIKCKNFELSTIPNNITKDESEKIKELLNNGVWKA